MLHNFKRRGSEAKWRLLILLLLVGVLSGYGQNCTASLSVEKDRNTRSADEDGTSFWIILDNTSSSSASYTISSVNLETPCENLNKRALGANVDLAVSIADTNSKTIQDNKLVVRAGQSKRFKVNVSVPSGTPVNRWSCIELQAKSDNCQNISDTTILKVFVPDPSEG